MYLKYKNDIPNSIPPNSGHNLRHDRLFCGRLVRCKKQKEMQELSDNQRRELANRFDDLMAKNIRQADSQRQQLTGNTQMLRIEADELKHDLENGRIDQKEYERIMRLISGMP